MNWRERRRRLREIDRLLVDCPDCGVRALGQWENAEQTRGGKFCVACGYGINPRSN